MKFAIVEQVGGVRPHEREIGAFQTREIATLWIENNIKGDDKRRYRVEAR